MLSSYRAAISQYEREHKSKHWDVYDSQFESVIGRPESWRSFRSNGLTYGVETGLLITDRERALKGERLRSAVYEDPWEVSEIHRRYELLLKLAGRDFIRDFHECEIGKPFYLEVDGLKLNFDDLYLIYAAWQLQRSFELCGRKPKRIIEIGGGYGNLAAKLRKLFPESQVLIFDLPEASLLQSYYLREARPHDLIVGAKDLRGNSAQVLSSLAYDIALVPGWLGARMEGFTCELVINMRSMGEMNPSVVGTYFDFIHRNLRSDGLFYCVNRYSTDKVGVDVKFKDYPFDERWQFLVSQPQWLQTHLHELVARRSDAAVFPPPFFVLATFPEVSPPPAP